MEFQPNGCLTDVRRLKVPGRQTKESKDALVDERSRTDSELSRLRVHCRVSAVY